MNYYSEIDTPIGPITIVSDGTAITQLTMQPASGFVQNNGEWVRDDERLADARAQLESYFDGRLTRFELPLAPRGTPFQLRVWNALSDIPFGATMSYGELADAIGHRGAARAVGAANGANPIAIVVPCHRVIGADGTLTGYGGGIERKKYLLEHETAIARPSGQTRLGL